METEIKEIKPFKMNDSNQTKSTPESSPRRRTREQDDVRPPIVFGTGSRFNLPESIIQKLRDDGKVVGFVVYSSGNVEMKENYFDAIERGWKPLDSRQFPELSRQYELSPFGKTEEDYLIRKGGQIAMYRDKEIDDAETKHYDSEKQRQQYMSDMYKGADPLAPKAFADERTRHRSTF